MEGAQCTYLSCMLSICLETEININKCLLKTLVSSSSSSSLSTLHRGLQIEIHVIETTNTSTDLLVLLRCTLYTWFDDGIREEREDRRYSGVQDLFWSGYLPVSINVTLQFSDPA